MAGDPPQSTEPQSTEPESTESVAGLSMRKRWPGGVAVLTLAGTLALGACSVHAGTPSGSAGPTAAGPAAAGPSSSMQRARTQGLPSGPRPPWQLRPAGLGRGHLAKGSDPSALPGDLLIADKLNNRLLVVDPHGRVRWRFPRRGDLKPGQTFHIPDDAFFTPDGARVIATEEDDYVIRVIGIARHRILYTYGRPGVPGAGSDRLWNPDDAIMLPGGRILTADIKNQRVLLIAAHTHHLLRSWGSPAGGYHDPPRQYGAPNGAFPMGRGRFLVTEIRGDWVDAVDLHGHVFWSTHVPGVSYPSDTNRIGPDRFLSVDYSSPGQIVIFDRQGHTLWRYAPRGKDQLDHPSLALPLPNGDIVCTDDYHHRVIVVDPRTDKIVWQYGHTGISGRQDGYLDNPDGLDLVPPYSLASRMAR